MRRLFVFLLIALLGALCCAAAEESTLSMELSDYSFALKITLVPGTDSAGLYTSADMTGTPADRIRGDADVKLLGAGERYWIVQYGDTVGYVSKSRMTVEGSVDGHDPVNETVTSSSLKPASTMARPKDEKYILLEGSAELSEPVDYVAFFLWDEWQRKLERTWLYFPEEPVASLDASAWDRLLTTKDLAGGRKMLCIQGVTSGRRKVLARLPFFVAGKVETPFSLNSRCVFSPDEPRLQDSKVDTWWSPTEKKPELTVTLPEDGSAALIQMEWYEPPEKTDVTVYNEKNEVILNQTLDDGFYMDTVVLPDNARSVVIHPYGRRIRLSSVRVYDADYPKERVQLWQPMPDKLDILLFSTHQDDEILFYAGLTPWYSHLGKKMGIVYMANCNRNRYREAMEAIWFSGIRIHPVFLGYRDKEISSMKVASNIWPGSQEAIVREIRRCKPDVVVVQDLNGEYGHTQHKLTSLQVCQGVEYAADPSYDLESAAEYGTWNVKKLYVHLYEKNQVHMNWHIPLPEYGGFTPWEIAVEAFEMHHSQYGYFRMEKQSLTYDSSCFGLYSSTVGMDRSGDDMLENIE